MEAVQSPLTDRARKALRVAADRAASCQRQNATPEDVLWALAVIEVGPGRVALERLGLDIAKRVDELAGLPTDQSPDSGKLMDEAQSQSTAMAQCYVGTEHLALAVLSCGECPAGNYLRARGITPKNLRAAVKNVLGGDS